MNKINYKTQMNILDNLKYSYLTEQEENLLTQEEIQQINNSLDGMRIQSLFLSHIALRAKARWEQNHKK